MSNEQSQPGTYRRDSPGDRKEKTVATLASLAGAAALVWGISSAWVGFRGGVLTELANCAHRNELLSAKVERYHSERGPWLERIQLLEKQREQTAERLQGAVDRIRDLELGKRP